MANRRRCRALCAAALSALSLCGCAAYHVYRACGWQACAADAQITAAVSARLARQPVLRAPNRVYVQTLGGVVYLSGEVATDLQREIAAGAAREAPGVHAVVDSIALSYSGR